MVEGLSPEWLKNSDTHAALPVCFKVTECESGHGSLTAYSSKVLSNQGGGCHHKRKQGDSDNRSEASIERNIRRMKARVRAACRRFSPDHMITLTTRENITDFNQSLEHFRSFMAKCQRQDLISYYVAVPEKQKRGAWHWHIAVKGYVKANDLRNIWQPIHGGKGTASVNVSYKASSSEIERVDSITAYLIKYILKSIGSNPDIKIPRSRKLPEIQVKKGFCSKIKWLLGLIQNAYQINSAWQSEEYNIHFFDIRNKTHDAIGLFTFLYEEMGGDFNAGFYHQAFDYGGAISPDLLNQR